MELNICHLYPDILNLYGDRGNILCMQKRLEWRGIGVTVTGVSIGQALEASAYDLLFVGGGQDFEQTVLLADLRAGRAENIRAAIGPALSRCCFETGPEVPEAVRALLGSDAEGLCPPEEGVEGKFLVDLKETNRRRLLQLGLAPEHIDVSPDCTMCMQDVYWSHRATKGRRGTMASVIML